MSKKTTKKPEWNDRFFETKDYKASKTEMLQKKISLVSKNRKLAKEEWRQKQDALKRGQVPTEYKEWLGPKQKKFTAMSTFINDRSLYDEYQNRFRKDSVPKYQPLKKINHEKMRKDVEENEDKFLRVLNIDESRQPEKPRGRNRPITSTQPSKKQSRQVIDYAEDSDEEEPTQTFKTYEEYSKKEYKFNKDLNMSGSQKADQSGEMDEVIDCMNSDNIFKVVEEQTKFDYLETDLDS